MKKCISSLAAIFLLSEVTYANESTTGIAFGVASFEATNSSVKANTQYEIGFVTDTVRDDNIYIGYDLVVSTVDAGAWNVWGLDTDLKFGYQPLTGLSGYVLGGVCGQALAPKDSYGDSGAAWGWVYGVGAQYQFNKHFATSIEWKTKAVKTTINDVESNNDYTTLGLNLKYLF